MNKSNEKKVEPEKPKTESIFSAKNVQSNIFGQQKLFQPQSIFPSIQEQKKEDEQKSIFSSSSNIFGQSNNSKKNQSLPLDPKDFLPSNRTVEFDRYSHTYSETRQSESDVIVHVTRTGNKYHRAGCRYLRSDIPMPLSNAKGLYSPCSVCW